MANEIQYSYTTELDNNLKLLGIDIKENLWEVFQKQLAIEFGLVRKDKI